MANKIRVAVIGAGNMGRNHLRTYAALPNVELIALADINIAAKDLADEYNVEFHDDYKKMLKVHKPDAVSVVVPTPLHFHIGSDVMNAGTHCLIEKPIASTPDEATKLIATARRNNVIFTVGHIERYNPMIEKLKKLVETKEIGEITSIVVRRVGGFPAVEPKTDVIIDLAVHDIEIINYLLNSEPKNVYGHGSRVLHSSKIDSAELFLDYGQASGFIQANWITPVKIRNIAVTGTNGFVEGNYITQEISYYKHNARKTYDGFNNFLVTLGEPEQVHLTAETQEPLKIELGRFVKAIEEGKITGNGLVEPESARLALKIALTALEPSQLN